MKNKYVAIDLGAESGRIIVGDVSAFEVIHRFPNYPVKVKDSIYWDILGIFTEIKKGLRKAFSMYEGEIKSIGIDAWGVDFVLLDKNGGLIGNPYHYRDNRTDGIMDEVFQKISKKEIFDETGIQFMQINTLYQLYSYKKNNPEIYESAKYFLTIPDLLVYWLTGEKINEYSISTTQIYNPIKKDWAKNILEKLDLNKELFGKVVMPGTKVGALLRDVASELNADKDVLVIASASHDTASAVAAVPAVSGKNYAYLSSGTWSLLGIESDGPLINEKSFEYNFTNEGSSTGKIRFLKNIMGLWIIQQCKACWDQNEKNYSYTEIVKMAENAGASKFKIDPNDPSFLKPCLIDDSMDDRIKNYCKKTGQYIPENEAEIARGVFESLAETYTKTIKELEEVSGQKIEELYVIGGGSQNTLLCQLTADKAGISVFAGPVEATAIGNILVQMNSSGELNTIKDGRAAINEFNDIVKYEPKG